MSHGETTRAGVVGVGSMGQHHVRVYAELPDVDLVGVADVDRGRAASVARKHGTVPMERSRLLEAADAVSVAVPTRYHHEVAREAIESDTGVLVEKPFVVRPERGRTLVERARRRGVTLQVGHIERFNPAIQILEDVLAGHDIIAVSANRLGPPLDRTVVDGAVLDLMIHDIDVALSLVDDEVSAVNAIGPTDDDYVTAHLQFESGVVADLTASRVTQEKVRTLSITARDCWIQVDYTDQNVEIYRHSLPEYLERDGDIRYRHEGIVERPMVDSAEPLREEISSFVEAVRTGARAQVTGEDGLRALRVARRIDDAVASDPDVLEVDQP